MEFNGYYYIHNENQIHCCDMPTHVYHTLSDDEKRYVDSVMRECKYSPKAEEFNISCKKR